MVCLGEGIGMRSPKRFASFVAALGSQHNGSAPTSVAPLMPGETGLDPAFTPHGVLS